MFGETISRVFVWESDLFVKVLFKKKTIQWNQERRKKNENISKCMNFY